MKISTVHGINRVCPLLKKALVHKRVPATVSHCAVVAGSHIIKKAANQRTVSWNNLIACSTCVCELAINASTRGGSTILIDLTELAVRLLDEEDSR